MSTEPSSGLLLLYQLIFLLLRLLNQFSKKLPPLNLEIDYKIFRNFYNAEEGSFCQSLIFKATQTFRMVILIE